jgi:hypothetical protein
MSSVNSNHVNTHQEVVLMRRRVSSSILALLFVSVSALWSLPAFAGAPAPIFNVDLWSPIPLGAAIRVELRVIMMPMPKGLAGKLEVRRDGKRVAGAWSVDNRATITCGSKLRLAFKPAAPLVPGTYRVTGFPKVSRFSRRVRETVTVSDKPDQSKPTFAGLKGAYCVRSNPLYGCRSSGIGLRPGKVADNGGAGATVRFVSYIRRRGQPYDPAAGVEAALLPYAAQRLVSGGAPGRYILTLRALDRADNASDRICEVELKLPVPSCKVFPGAGPGGKRSIVLGLGTGLKRARCARYNRRTRRWVSAIDGVVLRFDARP